MTKLFTEDVWMSFPMGQTVKSAAKALLPPVIFNLVHRIRQQGIVFKGDYSTWDAAARDSRGYDDAKILKKVREATIKVRSGEAAYERDSVLFSEIQYSWPVLAGLLKVAAVNRNRLRVLDFGGSLGSFYFQSRRFFKGLDELGWFVVEQDAFVECGREIFESENLKFYHDIDECLKNETVDSVLLSSVLPYVQNPWKILAQLMDANISSIIIDLTFVIKGNLDRLTVQTVPKNIYSASYPAWFLSEENLLKAFRDRGYELIAQFDYPYHVQGVDAVYKGFIHEQS